MGLDAIFLVVPGGMAIGGSSLGWPIDLAGGFAVAWQAECFSPSRPLGFAGGLRGG
jgi:hypothetical protein